MNDSNYEQLKIDLKKLNALPPYNDFSNLCANDGYFQKAIQSKYSHSEIIRAKKELGLLKDSKIIEIDLGEESWNKIKEAAKNSLWIPEEYFMNDWVSDVCNFLKYGQDS